MDSHVDDNKLVLKKNGKSFYWAGKLLPKKDINRAAELYSFCRILDDIADSGEANSHKNLTDVKSIIKKNTFSELKNIHSIKYPKFLKESSKKVVIDLIEGLILDQKGILFKKEEELIRYSYHVAGTVGLMMSKIIGVKSEKAAQSAIDLGIGMQLTNIARDVYEDSKMKRIYLPANWIPDISLDNLNNFEKLSSEKNTKISNAIEKVISLSEKFYENGYAGLKYIPLSTRLGIFIAANVYRGIGIKIRLKKKKYNKDRVYLNTFEKIVITIKSISIFIFIPLINYKYQKIRNSFPNENL